MKVRMFPNPAWYRFSVRAFAATHVLAAACSSGSTGLHTWSASANADAAHLQRLAAGERATLAHRHELWLEAGGNREKSALMKAPGLERFHPLDLGLPTTTPSSPCSIGFDFDVGQFDIDGRPIVFPSQVVSHALNDGASLVPRFIQQAPFGPVQALVSLAIEGATDVLWSLDCGASTARPVAEIPGAAFVPLVLSPDGRQLAFATWHGPGLLDTSTFAARAAWRVGVKDPVSRMWVVPMAWTSAGIALAQQALPSISPDPTAPPTVLAPGDAPWNRSRWRSRPRIATFVRAADGRLWVGAAVTADGGAGVWTSNDDGRSWNAVALPSQPLGLHGPEVVPHPTRAGLVAVRTQFTITEALDSPGGDVWISEDNGRTWTTTQPFLDPDSHEPLAMGADRIWWDAAVPARLYAARQEVVDALGPPLWVISEWRGREAGWRSSPEPRVPRREPVEVIPKHGGTFAIGLDGIWHTRPDGSSTRVFPNR